jgi:hypothetical protein
MSATVIYESSTHSFNLSLFTGNFPSKLKLSRVTSLYKLGDNAVFADMNNYTRPMIQKSYISTSFLAYLSYLKNGLCTVINIHYYDLYFIQFHLYRKSKKRIKFSYDYPDNSPLMGPP